MSPQTAFTAPRIARAGQVALGALWLIDGALQFQPSMFGQAFISGVVLPGAKGQPAVIAAAITWLAGQLAPHVALFNAAAATLQVLIGLGLLYRPTVRLALLVSFAWVGAIWFAGEGLGMLPTGKASPLTGAPGAAPMYVVAGLMAWPCTDPAGGARYRAIARWCWSIVWLGSAALWLLPANSMASSVHDEIAAAPAGSGWLSGLLRVAADAAAGRGMLIAIAMSTLSAAIGASVLGGWRIRPFLGVSIVISAAYWLLGQGLGGVFTGQATDPGTAPLIILTASLLLASDSALEHRAVRVERVLRLPRSRYDRLNRHFSRRRSGLLRRLEEQ